MNSRSSAEIDAGIAAPPGAALPITKKRSRAEFPRRLERSPGKGRRTCFFSSLGLFLCAMVMAFAQKVTTKVTVYNEIFLTDSGLVSLPDNAIELECAKTIISKDFASPLKLALGPGGDLYVMSSGGNLFCRYSSDGIPLGPPGPGAGGKSLLKGPEEIEVHPGGIAIHERPSGRISFFSLLGAKIESRKVPDIDDFTVDKEGRPIVAPLVDRKETPLVMIFAQKGQIQGFGKALVFAHSLPALNARSIAVNDGGDIYVAFRYFPVVRKYSSAGSPLAEYRIESPALAAKERFNLKAIGEGITDPAQRSQYRPLIIEIECLGSSVYLLSHNPRLEITELDGGGAARATYWMDSREIYLASDLAVREREGEKLFYVAYANPPEYRIDILRVKPQAPTALEGEIRKWTEEIGLYPDNGLAYINRGMARHLNGEFAEAIADFSRAIVLVPGSSVAYNNRGLSRVKTKDYAGAVSDLSKAIELDPKAAAAHFNRGIARIHTGDLRKAIEDFEAAARLDSVFEARAKEQIDYCRSRLEQQIRRSPVRIGPGALLPWS